MGSMKRSNLAGILVLLVFAVFMVSVLMVLLTGADVVKKLTQRDQQTYNHRTTVQYITTRIHQADQAGMIGVRSSEGKDVLVLAEDIDGRRYETLVYCFDGYLREMFCAAGLDLDPEYGEKILPLESFGVTKDGDCLQIRFAMCGGSEETLIFRLRCGGGAVS